MKRLRWYDHITINLFWLGLNIRNTAVGSVFTPYLVALFVPAGRQNTALGVISTAGLIIAMLVQPAAGLLSDRSTSRFGRRRPFIFIGSLFDLVFLAAIALSGNYIMLLIATLFIQFSANVSHGALQGLIPDLVPEEQRGRSSAVKAVLELIPIVLVGFTIAQLVGRGQLGWAVFATGAALLVTMLLTMVLVREQPLKEKPTTSFKIPMLRVLGMLAGIALGAVAGLVSGGAVGGLVGLAFWPFLGKAAALAVMVGLGGVVAMVVAVVAGVRSGAYAILGRDASRQSSFTWWVVNRLLFLAAATSFQGFLPFFLMYAFKVDAAKAASMNGTLMTIIGMLILLTAFETGWTTDPAGRKRLMGFGIILIIIGLVFFALINTLGILPLWPGILLVIIQLIFPWLGLPLIALGVFTLLFTPVCGVVATRFGQKGLVGFSGLLAAVGGCMVLGTIWFPDLVWIYVAGGVIGLGTGLFMTANWALGTDLVPADEAGRYLGISNLAGAGAGMIGKGIGGPIADYLNGYLPGLGYFAIFASYAVLFILSAVSLRWVRKVER